MVYKKLKQAKRLSHAEKHSGMVGNGFGCCPLCRAELRKPFTTVEAKEIAKQNGGVI